MKTHYQNSNATFGFTLSEMLLTLSICAIFFSVVIIGATSIRANMNKLTALESAKEIYIAAQNHLLELKETGDWDDAKCDFEDFPGEHIKEKPSDFDYWMEIAGSYNGISEDYTWGDDGNMFVLSSYVSDEESFIRSMLLPYGVIDDLIIEGANYYIELNAKTGVVYGVYYCLGDTKYSDISDCRENEFEINDEIVGYYGGGILSDLSLKAIADPYIELINGEDLTLKLSIDKSLDTSISIEIEGESSKKSASLNINEDYTYFYNGEKHAVLGGVTSGVSSYEVILDSLTKYEDENKHFANLFPDFYPGENLIINVYVRPAGEYLAPAIIRKYEVNSLFDSIDENISISTVRHLENLDKRISNLDEKVDISNKAEILSNISFSGFGEGIKDNIKKNYLDCKLICTYDDKEEEIFNPVSKSFYPINLYGVDEIIGNGYKFYDLSINLKGYENVGIIGCCNDITIRDFGLIGSYESEYLKYPSFNININSDINAGAFVGRCNSAKIYRCYSTAKIVVNNEESSNIQKICVGGFVGKTSSFIEIKNSYGGGIVDSNGVYEDSIVVKISKNEDSKSYVGGFVGCIESDEMAEAFIYKSYQTQSIKVCGATDSDAWLFEGGFIGGMRFDDANIDIDNNSYIAAPIKSDINSVTLDEIISFKNGEGQARKIRFGGIIGGFQNASGSTLNKDPQASITIDARYINYFADYCGVPELLSNNNREYSGLVKLKDVGLYYRNNYGISVNVGEVVLSEISKDNTYPISNYLSDRGYSFEDPTKLGHHYGDWQVKEYGTFIKVSPGHGISSVDYGVYKYDEDAAIVNYGDELDLSLFKINNEEGYEGIKYELASKTDGSSGILIKNNDKYIYVAGVGTCEFLCSATSIKAPTFEIIGGGEFVYNYEDVMLQITNKQIYAHDIALTYSIASNDITLKEESEQIKNSETFSSVYTILKNAYRGLRLFVIKGKVSDGILESKISVSDPREVILSRVRVIFNKNDTGSAPHGVSILPASFGYVEYGSSDIYEDETSMKKITPLATRTSYEFLGWSKPIGEIYMPTNLNDINLYALWKKIRHKVYTYSQGGWFYE